MFASLLRSSLIFTIFKLIKVKTVCDMFGIQKYGRILSGGRKKKRENGNIDC